jgi:hypothetical protein
MPRRFVTAGLALGVALAARPARADEAPPRPKEPGVTVTWPWLLTQLVPSPELVYGDATARFGVRWQVTPLLLSWGIHHGLSPWRFLVVEPNVRQSGSVELYVTPEIVTSGGALGPAGIFRSGARAYFPLVEHGEYLSCSIGASQFFDDGHSEAGFEAGIYTLFGAVGLQVTVSPWFSPMATTATLSLRYF